MQGLESERVEFIRHTRMYFLVILLNATKNANSEIL